MTQQPADAASGASGASADDGIETLLAERLADQSLPQPHLWISHGPQLLSHPYTLLAVRRGWLKVASLHDERPREIWINLAHCTSLEPDEGPLEPAGAPPPAGVSAEPQGSRRRARRGG